jgi:hypothetical protein
MGSVAGIIDANIWHIFVNAMAITKFIFLIEVINLVISLL